LHIKGIKTGTKTHSLSRNDEDKDGDDDAPLSRDARDEDGDDDAPPLPLEMTGTETGITTHPLYRDASSSCLPSASEPKIRG
jgi:hypothetical protein